MSDVKYVSLKELCTVNQGLQIPISERYTEPGENRFFYITVQFLKDKNEESFYIENPPKSTICYKDDIIVVRTGSTGQVLTGIEGCFHNNFFKVNYNKLRLNHKYLYYCLTSKENQKEMYLRSGITTIPDLNHFMFLDIKIPFQELPTQQKIASVLSALDDKIELNNRINAELEAMAKTLYDYWFVQFDFPIVTSSGVEKPYKSSGGKMVYNETLKREIPEGWEVKSLSGLVDFTRGISYTSSTINDNEGIPMINLKSFNLNGTYRIDGLKYFTGKLNENKIINKNDLLIAITDVTREAEIIGKAILSPDFGNKTVCSCDVARIDILKNSFSKNYLRYLFNSNHYHNYIKHFASGTLVLHLDLNGILWYKDIIPPINLQNKFEDVVNEIDEKITNNLKQNQELSALRDWLLPMLMNGQVKVG